MDKHRLLGRIEALVLSLNAEPHAQARLFPQRCGPVVHLSKTILSKVGQAELFSPDWECLYFVRGSQLDDDECQPEDSSKRCHLKGPKPGKIAFLTSSGNYYSYLLRSNLQRMLSHKGSHIYNDPYPKWLCLPSPA